MHSLGNQPYKFYIEMNAPLPKSVPEQDTSSIEQSATSSVNIAFTSELGETIVKKVAVSDTTLAKELVDVGAVLFELDTSRKYDLYCQINKRGSCC
jgi:hypothetical protein